MRDPEFDDTPTGKSATPRRRHLPKFFGVAAIALVSLWLLGIPVISQHPYTCAVCRLSRVDHNVLGLRWSSREETNCSRWYEANVERAHAHVWARCTHCRSFGLPGVFSGYSCFVGGPITGLSTRVQIQIYEHFQDRLEAKRLFIRLGNWDAGCPALWDALMGWLEADYPGTWDEWRAKHPPKGDDGQGQNMDR